MNIKSFIVNYLRKNRILAVRFSNFLNSISLYFQVWSRRIIKTINHETSDHASEWFILNKPDLLKKINKIRTRQKKEYPHYSYFYNYPYQAFSTLSIFGERSTEERFTMYKLGEYINKTHKILDLGCNCGFMGIYTSYRIGCQVDGIDINPHAIEIGQLCSSYLNVDDKVHLKACRVQDFKKNQKYNGIFSFATHWTDDNNYRVQLKDHFALLWDLLENDGILFFESHCTDVGDKNFYSSIAKITTKFQTLYRTDTDAGSRHYYILRKIS
jgi:hypothetical protein